MKISPLIPSFVTPEPSAPGEVPGLVRAHDGGGGGNSPGQDSSHGRRNPRNPYAPVTESAPEAEASLEEIRAAVASFEQEAGKQPHGLHAQVEEPGLRVLLIDSQGRVLRRLSGTEFVKLRAASRGAARIPGKILDQKL